MCETTPLPWDPGTPIDQRLGGHPAADRRAAAGRVRAVRPAIVVEDEIDLCLRWPDVPRPAASAAPLPYPTVPTLILQGGEDLRTPPEWSANVAARIPGAQRFVIPGVGHSTVSDPRDCAADAIQRFVRGAKLAEPLQARSRPACRRSDRRRRASSRSTVVPGYPRKIGRTLNATAGDDRGPRW